MRQTRRPEGRVSSVVRKPRPAPPSAPVAAGGRTERPDEAEAFIRATLDASPSGLCVLDLGGRVVMVNRTWRRIAADDGAQWNRVEEGVDYLALCDRARPAIPEAGQVADGLRSLLGSERPDFHLEYADQGPLGERWFVMRATRLPEPFEARVIVTRFDVTKRREVEDEIRAERDFVAAVLGNTRALVAVTDREGRILRFNRACEEASGYTFNEARGKSFGDLGLVGTEDVDDLRRVAQQVLHGAAVLNWENDWHRRDGTRRRIAWSTVALADPDGGRTYVVSSGIDVTAQREAEARASERQEELLHLARLHTAGELAATLAHELGQPLAAIAAYAESSLMSLGSQTGAPGPVSNNLEKIVRQAMRAGEFVNGIRRFVGKGESLRRAEDLGGVVRSAAEMVAPLSRRRRVRVRFDLGSACPAVMMTAVQIEHVVVNLLRNAIDAIGAAGMSEGEVTVRTAAGEPGFAIVCVSDTGPGVAPADLERVFDAFYTTRPNGLGMGLRISRSIVETHGGRIWAEAGPGGRFCFTLEAAR